MRRIFTVSFFLLTVVSYAGTYYSQATAQPFSNLTNWNSNAGGGGSNPVVADLTSGANTFVIQNGHNITVDQDINVLAISVNGTAAVTTLTIGNNATGRNVVINGGLSVTGPANNFGTLVLGATAATHTLTVSGDITSSGASFNLAPSATRICNTTLNGSGLQQIAGTRNPIFNDLTISTSGSVNINNALTVSGNYTVNGGAAVTTGVNETITGSFSVAGGSSFTSTTGTTTFNGVSTQLIDVTNCGTFTGMTFSTGNKTITGDITNTGNFTINAGVTVTSAGNSTLSGGTLTIANTGVCAFSGNVSFAGTLTSGWDYTTGNFVSMGTATWTFTGAVTLATSAAASRFDFAHDVTVLNSLNIQNNTSINSTDGSNFFFNGATTMTVGGLTKPVGSGGVTNFPSGFSTYNFATTSTVNYSYAATLKLFK